MTDPAPRDADPADHPPEKTTITDSAGKELTKPAPGLIIPATLIAIALCALFLYLTRGSDDVAPAAGDDGVTIELDRDGDGERELDLDIDLGDED